MNKRKRGRPRLPKSQQRTNVVSAFLTDDEMRVVLADSKRENLPVALLVRKRVLGMLNKTRS